MLDVGDIINIFSIRIFAKKNSVFPFRFGTWSPPNPHWAPKVPTSKSREEKSREMRLTAAVKTSMVA